MKAALPLLVALLLATPAAAQDERRWTFVDNADSVHLGYGTPDSDDAVATFACQKGSNNVELYLTFEHRIAAEAPTADGEWLDSEGRPAPWPVDIKIADIFIRSNALPDEMNGGSTVNVLMPPADRILTSMAASGQLRAEAFGETIAPPPFRKADFQRFLKGCQG